MNELIILKNKISELEKEVKSLRQNSTMPLEIIKSFQNTGFVRTFSAGIPDPAGDYITNVGFRQDISLSGGAETITVPAYPVRFLRLNDGSNLFIPLHAYAEFF